MFALDTNTLVYYFKGQGRVADHLLASTPDQIAIPTIVLYEIENGIAGSAQPQKRRQALNELLSVVNVLPFDYAAAQAASMIRINLEKEGSLIGPLDLLIAGIAVSQGAILVTHNAKEFSRIPHLRSADWY